MIRLVDVGVALGGVEVLREVNLHLHPGERVGIVGSNGSGKTTLLRLIAGDLCPDDGTATLRPGIGFRYLSQRGAADSARPVWDEARSGMVELERLRGRLDDAQVAADAGAEGSVETLAAAEEAWRMAGGYAQDEAVGQVLHGLGFAPEDWRRPCSELSGGWQMRVALARVLLSKPDLLLLDEPTNHLDIVARSWLARFLARYDGTVVVVSHDRHLLDVMANRIVEARFGRITSFKGNLSAWVQARELIQAQQASAFTAQQKELQRLERFVERFKAKPSKASQARSRQKVIDKMALVDAPVHERRPRLVLPEPPESSHELVELEGVTLGWPQGPDVLADVNLLVTRGMRLAVVGVNGCGKSTLLGALASTLSPRAGRRRVGEGLRIGRLAQDLLASYSPETTGLEMVCAASPGIVTAKARAALGALGLAGDSALRPLSELSGGERTRAALATFGVRPANLLLLDEPTNHLDAVTVDVLIDALDSWPGAMIVVTHDRYLVERLCTHLATVSNGRVVVKHGIVPADLDRSSLVPEEVGSTEQAARAGAVTHADRKKQRQTVIRAKRRIERITVELESLESRLQALENEAFEAASSYAESTRIETERLDLASQVEGLFAEWASLDEVAAKDDCSYGP